MKSGSDLPASSQLFRIGSITCAEAAAMAEEIEQNEYANRLEWPILALAIGIFIIVEETIRYFATSRDLQTFICCCLGFTIGNFNSKESKGIGRDALRAVEISSAVCLASSVFAPLLKKFMPAYLAYSLPIFLMTMGYYVFVRIIGQQANIYNYLKVSILMAVFFGALYTLLP
jgi:hypothetical protein